LSAILQELLAQGVPDPLRIGQFLAARPYPHVDGRSVTFVHHGRADQVLLRHWIYGLPSSQPFHRLDGTDLWFLEVDVPERSRIEYKIERVFGSSREWIMDPLNPREARDPFGTNSVCYGAGYEAPSWVEPDPEARAGELVDLRVRSRRLGGVRRVQVYLPARFRRQRRYPLLVLHDGRDYLEYAELRVVLDNLIHRLEIPPMIVAASEPRERLGEYAAEARHADFVSHELLPKLEARFPLVARASHRGLAGASFGAVAALHAAWRSPGLWGRLLLQSGSFAFSDIGPHRRGAAFDPVVDFVNEFRERPGRPSEKVFVSCGVFESLIYENRSLVPLLQSTGMEVRYVEARDGHNWDNWRDRLREGLSWLFPGPLWMVYE
jgi:enterochelin esterase-like enzyme